MSRAGLLLLCLAAPLVHAFDPPDTSPLPRRRVVGPAALSLATKSDLSAVAEASNRFALDLYSEMREGDGNLFFSPLSVWASLAMASAGARGPTLEEMTKALHLPASGKVHPALGQLLKQLPSTRGTQVNAACGLWGQKGVAYNPEFLRLLREHYQAGFDTAEFAGATEKARLRINGWVEKQTQQQIRDLLKPGSIEPATGLVLTNAIYFKGSWANAFPPELTRDGTFHGPQGRGHAARMMNQPGQFAYRDSGALQALELPYTDGSTSMVVLLPRKPSLASLEKELTSARLTRLLGELRKSQVEVTLPRFSLSVETRLQHPLKQLGLARAFTHAADFSGMTRERKLNLSAVIHKAKVEVEERGTTAAAATAALLERTVIQRAVFRADRPFVFLIRDTRTGCILFLGRVTNPRA